MTPTELAWLQYANQGATRNDPLSPELIKAMAFLPGMGVTMKVFSGGQEATGPNRTGSHRHDHGGAGDVFFYKDGRQLDWANQADVPIFQDIVKQARAAGVTGFGAGPGYMQPGSMHIGFGAPAVWGAGGKGANAPEWLRASYGMAQQTAAPQMATASAQPAMAAPTTGGGAAEAGQAAARQQPAAEGDWRSRIRKIFQGGQDSPASALASMLQPQQQEQAPPAQFTPRQGYQAPEDPIARAYRLLNSVRQA